MLYGWTSYGSDIQSSEPLLETIRNAATRIVETDYPGLVLEGIHFNAAEDPPAVLIEVRGKNAPTSENREQTEKKISDAVQRPVRVLLWFKPEVLWTPSGEASMHDMLRHRWEKNEAQAIKEWSMR